MRSCVLHEIVGSTVQPPYTYCHDHELKTRNKKYLKIINKTKQNTYILCNIVARERKNDKNIQFRSDYIY